MSVIRNVRVSLPNAGALGDHPGENAGHPAGDCSIHIRADQGWVVTGEYRNNQLYAVKLERDFKVDGGE